MEGNKEPGRKRPPRAWELSSWPEARPLGLKPPPPPRHKRGQHKVATGVGGRLPWSGLGDSGLHPRGSWSWHWVQSPSACSLRVDLFPHVLYHSPPSLKLFPLCSLMCTRAAHTHVRTHTRAHARSHTHTLSHTLTQTHCHIDSRTYIECAINTYFCLIVLSCV